MSETNKPSAEQFFTRERANTGIMLPLALPDGTPTSHYIRIRGIDSDAFKAAEADGKRRLMALAVAEEKDRLVQAAEEERIRLMAALVIDWSFDLPCDLTNITRVLREAPQIADQIDRLSAKRSLFFALSSTSSTPTPVPSSS